MEKEFIIDVLLHLNSHKLIDFQGDLIEFYACKVTENYNKINFEAELYKEWDEFNADDKSNHWKYISLNISLLFTLNNILNKNKDVLSVQQTKLINTTLHNIILCGIIINLQPKLPYKNLPKNDSILVNYNQLIATTNALNKFLKCFHLRTFVVTNLRYMLVSLYQIIFCPLKKPSEQPDVTGFLMTPEVYNNLLKQRAYFHLIFKDINDNINRSIYVRETMLLVHSDSPVWFKKSVACTLNSIIISNKGIENIASSMLDVNSDDCTKTWESIDVITKLVLSCRKMVNFHENICIQVINLLNIKNSIFERVFVSCAKGLYNECNDNVLVERVIAPLAHFISKNYSFHNNENITDYMHQAIRLNCFCFVDNPTLPTHLLLPVIDVIFRLYVIITTDSEKITKNNLENLILVCLKNYSYKELYKIFDSFIFGIDTKFRNDLELQEDNGVITVTPVNHLVLYPTEMSSNALFELLRKKTKLILVLFSYLLKCLTESEKYFKTNSNVELLDLEEKTVLSESLTRKLIVYKLLSDLTEDKNIQSYIHENPDDVINYIKTILINSIEVKTHQGISIESEEFQSLFTIIMILQALIENNDNRNQFIRLLEPLSIIFNETKNLELKQLTKEILTHLQGDIKLKQTKKEEELTEVEKAIEDVCDPLLPVRGHGLIALTKLIEKKDKHTMERKQYILNIFQQNLKNEDSFIYLTAIDGLAVLANVFPDVVLNVLTGEYADFSRKDEEDGHEIRMKLGEVLVRVTKMLGEMAPKYKTLLLNTFLVGTKDDDHLIRASSLSNLGEVCRVLGYKLGTIVSEVLVCVHAIITTDKAIEARRAAVTVIRQLFVGLESEMIAFLKEEILTIYRSLKNIYSNDSDDIMRLQAQLALEELNENMKQFIFPNPTLNFEKKVILLD